MDKVFVRAPFAYDADEASDFSRTNQSFKEECDINTICGVLLLLVSYPIMCGFLSIRSLMVCLISRLL